MQVRKAEPLTPYSHRSEGTRTRCVAPVNWRDLIPGLRHASSLEPTKNVAQGISMLGRTSIDFGGVFWGGGRGFKGGSSELRWANRQERAGWSEHLSG